jgi:TRAP-type uncharacterized transport system substrate-binding protein
VLNTTERSESGISDFWEKTLRTSVRIASGYAGSYSMTRTIGRALSWGPLKKDLLMLVPLTNSLEMVEDGDLELSWSVPAVEARWAMEGRGPGHSRPLPRLRAIARFPQDDSFMVAVAPWSKVQSLEQIAEERFPARVAVRRNPGGGYGWFENQIFSRYGFTLEDLVAWGGRHWTVRVEWGAVAREVDARDVDLVVGEARTQKIWNYLAARGFRFLGLRREVVDALVREVGMEENLVPCGFLPGIDAPLLTIDESDFVLVARDDADADLIYELARIVDQNRKKIEEGAVVIEYAYTQPLPVQEMVLQSPLTGPLADIWRTPIPLHTAAQRYYRERGLLTTNS